MLALCSLPSPSDPLPVSISLSSIDSVYVKI